MDKIVDIKKAIKLSEGLRKEGKVVVLAGGCFDLLHIGHITFLEKAKAEGDALFIFLEADEHIRAIKGEDRPVNNQEDRAKILAALEPVDFVILLPPDLKDEDYNSMIKQINPDIIAITKGDPFKLQKERQAKNAGGRLIEVTHVISDKSTSRLIKLLGEGL